MTDVGDLILSTSKLMATASSLPASLKRPKNCCPSPKTKANRTCRPQREAVRERPVKIRIVTTREHGFTTQATGASLTGEEVSAGLLSTEATPTHIQGEGSTPAEGGRTTEEEAVAWAGEVMDTRSALRLPACTYVK